MNKKDTSNKTFKNFHQELKEFTNETRDCINPPKLNHESMLTRKLKFWHHEEFSKPLQDFEMRTES